MSNQSGLFLLASLFPLTLIAAGCGGLPVEWMEMVDGSADLLEGTRSRPVTVTYFDTSGDCGYRDPITLKTIHSLDMYINPKTDDLAAMRFSVSLRIDGNLAQEGVYQVIDMSGSAWTGKHVGGEDKDLSAPGWKASGTVTVTKYTDSPGGDAIEKAIGSFKIKITAPDGKTYELRNGQFTAMVSTKDAALYC